MTACELLSRRVWTMAKQSATESEAWRMQFLISKARESETEELRLKFLSAFNRLAADILERGLPFYIPRLPALPEHLETLTS